MKKLTAIISATAMLALCAPVVSGCGGGGVKFTLSEEGGKHYIVSCSSFSSLSGEYEIPAYFGDGETYAPVTAIADEGFASTNFTKITVPETVTEIGVAAFSFCYYLQTVEFADGIKLDKFSHGMFGKSVGLQEIKIPDSVTTLDGLVFKGCENLSSVTFGENVETIGARAFESCAALESITFPSTLISIGDMAFCYSGLKEVELPESLKDTEDKFGLGYAAFGACDSLERVKLLGGIKTIPSSAFGYCRSLREIYIPLSVEEVQGAYYENGVLRYGHAFYGDIALTDVYYEGDEGQWKDIRIETKNAYANEMTMDNDALINAEKHYKSN